MAGLQRGVSVKDVSLQSLHLLRELPGRITDAVLQRGIKTPGTAPLPRLLQVRQRQCKLFQKIFMCTSAVWRESGLNVSLCAVAMPRGFRHLQSQPHISSHAHPALPLSAHKRLCLDQTEHYAQLGHSQCFVAPLT